MEFKIGDIVWTKVSGYPDWPCVISDITDNKILVYFFGDRTQ
jgi:PWWP domain